MLLQTVLTNMEFSAYIGQELVSRMFMLESAVRCAAMILTS